MSTSELLNVIQDSAISIQKTQINLKKCPKTRLSKGYIEAKIEAIQDYWDTIKNAHRELVKRTPKEQKAILPYFSKEEYYTYEEEYMSLSAELRDILHSMVTASQGQSQSTSTIHDKEINTAVRLPRIQLPVFSGKYEEWTTFQDLFTSLVHNNSKISDVEKLHYLKLSLTGEAEALLRHVQVTSNNYQEAFNTLKNRYGNKRLIVNSVLKQLYNQRKITFQSPQMIKSLLDTTSECLNNLKNMSINTDSWDPLIIFLVVQKLDTESHKQWEQYAYKESDKDLPTWNDLRTFLESTFSTLELVNFGTKDKPIRERSFHTHTTSSTQATIKICLLCKEQHALYHCNEFIQMRLNERIQFIKNNNLCYNCFKPGHSAKKCRLELTCRTCKRHHHSLIHQPKETNSTVPEDSMKNNMVCNSAEEQEHVNVNTMTASHYSSNQCKNTALLATAMIRASNDHYNTLFLRALIDPGSQTSLISEKAAHMLKLTREAARGSVIGVGSSKTEIKHRVKLQISSLFNTNYCMDIQAYVMAKQLTNKIPSNAICVHEWKHLEGIQLADPNFDKPGPIDLLLGVKEYAQILQQPMIKGPPGTPSAQKTQLGWILFGEVEVKQQYESYIVLHQQLDMDMMLKSLWEIDSEYNRKLTKDERLCEEIYETSYTRTEQGKYIVKLPFKSTNPKCLEGNTKEIARKRLYQLERKFRQEPTLKTEYKKVIEEYITLNHLEEIPKEETLKENVVYLPHHAVVRTDKETTKTRIVFDASAKGTNQISLNDDLLIGPQLQEDLRHIIMRWRLKRICFVSDIVKMYRQILVYPEDADSYQRILWRDNEYDEIKEYRLLRLTFGTASAPYLAVKTLHQVANDEGQNYPRATQIIHEDFYMDDLMGGEDCSSQAIERANEIANILKKGGLPLAKWSSNCPEFMKSIQEEDRSKQAHLGIKMFGIVKTLGLIWNLETDSFRYQLKSSKSPNKVTKRIILSEIQQLFDPLGWIAPSVLKAKMLMQKLWLEKVNWDDSISSELQEEWLTICDDMKHVNDISIDRWLGTISTDMQNIQIHGFSDASMYGYSAVVYIRTVSSDGSVYTRLIAARTRLAPLKTISIPRLELSGALLLSRLLHQVSQAMRIPKSQMFSWTDSTIVIAWLSGDPHRWKPFVANRVVEIIENTNNNQWYHVASENNPADIASRGMLLNDLIKNKPWWYGPKFLSEKEIILQKPNIDTTDLELKKVKIHINMKIQENENINSLTPMFSQFDDLKELLRVITHCRRFLYFKKNSSLVEKGMIFTTEELETSLRKCIKLVQFEEWSDDINRLKLKKNLKKNSTIKSFNPFIDHEGILRVGGRLRHAHLNEESKHPIILGHNNNLTQLIIADAHVQTLHGGIQLMMSYLRTKYWIIRSKTLVKAYIHKCLVCAKLKASARIQIMGDLPKVRVNPARAFLNAGVDFAGPFQILMSRGRGLKTQKAYIALFVCMATKAIHLELVGDLTSEAFIGAFKRFVSRRGKCSHIYSDQGRNFVGAEKELLMAWQEASLNFEKDIANKLAQDGTQWHFIPAYSPNFGGLWEAGVKSLKFHLKRVLTTNLTFEEMTTVLCQVEACLNSRPLCPIDDNDPESIEPLTPGHFLIQEAPIVVPSPDFKDINIGNLSRWQYTQKLVGDIWRRWHHEYLSRLQQRPKWKNETKEFDVGDIVLIKTDGLPPGKWALGRIVNKHPGADGLTRVYSVKSGINIVKRSITKLCPLPIDTK